MRECFIPNIPIKYILEFSKYENDAKKSLRQVKKVLDNHERIEQIMQKQKPFNKLKIKNKNRIFKKNNIYRIHRDHEQRNFSNNRRNRE